jgi:hypothetical protein
MKLKHLATPLLILSASLLLCLPAGAQPSTADITAALTQMFGGQTGFTARAELTVVEENNKEGSIPFSLAWSEGKVRLEVELSLLKSDRVPADILSGIKKAGLDKVTALVLPGTKLAYLIAPGIQTYAEQPLPTGDASAKESKIKVEKTETGKEVFDGHPCVKYKVVVTAEGQTQELTLWSATDLKGFPVKIYAEAVGNKITLRTKEVKLAKPESKEFEVPASFTKVEGIPAMVAVATAKFNAANGQ